MQQKDVRQTRPLEVDGKFFRSAGERVFLKAVTYGPFPDPQPLHHQEMQRVAGAGFNAIRIYGTPEKEVLDAAHDADLWVIMGLSWQWGCDFVSRPSIFSMALVELTAALKQWGGHPALAIVLVANEIPPDMVRWMGVSKVRHAIEELIDCGREVCPELIFAYANYPSTEYLEPDNADLTAMNVYLERREELAAYLPRLHNVAGDRPVWISEFGFDSRRGSEMGQRDVLLWLLKECLQHGMAGTTVYSWSDRWLNGGRVMDEWAFGLTDEWGRGKPALTDLSKKLPAVRTPEDGLGKGLQPMVSVVVCTFNGGGRMGVCLTALCALDYPHFEIIVIDDGSTDNTCEVVRCFDQVRLISLQHVGLSAARNHGAEVALGEIVAYTDDDCEPDSAWLRWLADTFFRGGWDACGGPNLPPVPAASDRWEHVDEAVVASAPGAPSHVLLRDGQAEHLPGCNLAIKRHVLLAIGGFRPRYRVAGDDVDLCWRLDQAGYRMGFCGAAFVWHRRRTTLWRYFRQQFGYGKAEALLMRDHPDKFRRGGGARWHGRVYAGGAMCADEGSVIYHGSMGSAAYQQVYLVMQPQRPLPQGFRRASARFKLALAQLLQPQIRAAARWFYSLRWRSPIRSDERSPHIVFADNMLDYDEVEARWQGALGVNREQVLEAFFQRGWLELEGDGSTAEQREWDLTRNGLKLLVACEQHDEMSLVLTRLQMSSRTQPTLPDGFGSIMQGLGLKMVCP